MSEEINNRLTKLEETQNNILLENLEHDKRMECIEDKLNIIQEAIKIYAKLSDAEKHTCAILDTIRNVMEVNNGNNSKNN